MVPRRSQAGSSGIQLDEACEKDRDGEGAIARGTIARGLSSRVQGSWITLGRRRASRAPMLLVQASGETEGKGRG